MKKNKRLHATISDRLCCTVQTHLTCGKCGAKYCDQHMPIDMSRMILMTAGYCKCGNKYNWHGQ